MEHWIIQCLSHFIALLASLFCLRVRLLCTGIFSGLELSIWHKCTAIKASLYTLTYLFSKADLRKIVFTKFRDPKTTFSFDNSLEGLIGIIESHTYSMVY